jgi:hypothetical protein
MVGIIANHVSHHRLAMPRLRSFFVVLCIVHVLAVCFATQTAQSAAPGEEIPFQIGEKLRYKLKWTVIPVGIAVFEVLDGTMETGTPSYLVRLTVESYPIVDLIYKVRDRIESYMDRSMTHSLLYRKKQREGRHRRDVEVRFDWDQLKAFRYNKGKHESTVDVLPKTFDPLGVFYAFRLNPITDGLEVAAPVTEGKKSVMGKARVVKRETVTLADRDFDTYLIEPDLQHVGGVFEKSKDAKIQVWVTADARRIVVKLKSKVIVGHFSGELLSAEGLLE